MGHMLKLIVFFKVKQMIGQGKGKKEMKFHYIVKEVFERNTRKWLLSLTPRKKWSDSIEIEFYKILVQMVEENNGSCK